MIDAENKLPRRRPRNGGDASPIEQSLAVRLIGQPEAIGRIAPYVQMQQAGLAPEGRPIAVFLLLGPTGTGKTRTVEALADVLHGNEKMLLKVDCGEFQMEHEVAKLIGAPPGYLGHRETHPILSQQRVNAVTTDRSNVSLILFDEIEKAAPSMTRLLLGVLDKGTLRLGDNNTVHFERSMIFLTSNLGAGAMKRALRPEFGYETAVTGGWPDSGAKLERIGLAAVRKRFSPEFINRIDEVITYQPLTPESLSMILEQELAILQRHIDKRLGTRGFQLVLSRAAKSYLLRVGSSIEHGARELKRTIHRKLTQPLSALVTTGLPGGIQVRVEYSSGRDGLIFRPMDPPQPAPDPQWLISGHSLRVPVDSETPKAG